MWQSSISDIRAPSQEKKLHLPELRRNKKQQQIQTLPFSPIPSQKLPPSCIKKTKYFGSDLWVFCSNWEISIQLHPQAGKRALNGTLKTDRGANQSEALNCRHQVTPWNHTHTPHTHKTAKAFNFPETKQFQSKGLGTSAQEYAIKKLKIMTIIGSKVPYWEVSMTWNKRNTGWFRIQWGSFVMKYWDNFSKLPRNTGRSAKERLFHFLLWMEYSLCSPTELVTLHSYSFRANDAMQDLQRRLSAKGFKRAMLWVKREDAFLCHWNTQAPNKCETQADSHPINEQFLRLHTDHLQQRQ